MRYEYIHPFVKTAVHVLECTIPGTHTRGDVTVVRGDRIGGEVHVVIALAGDSPGSVIISMKTETAKSICSHLLGAATEELTPAALDALAELGNMIAGNSVGTLNDLGFDFTVAPPIVSVKDDTAGYGDREALRIPLLSAWGEMNVNVMLGAD
jgi:chemotaxis protein CheX